MSEINTHKDILRNEFHFKFKNSELESHNEMFEWFYSRLQSLQDKIESNDRLWENEVAYQMNKVGKLENKLTAARVVVDAYQRYDKDPNFRNAVLRIHAISKYNEL
jgi:hypothetical protein